jgi:hypothetical protein
MVVPALIPVKIPFDEPMVATPVFELDQAPPEVTSVRFKLNPTQTSVPPFIGPTGVTFIIVVA